MGSIDTEVAIPETLQVSLPVTAELRQQLTPAGVIAVAESYTIDCPEMADMANTELRQVKARWKALDEMRKKFVEPARQMIANAQEMFNPALEQYAAAESIYKRKLTDWQNAEAARIQAENRKREEEARLARQKAEQEAAAARARAEEQAKEQRRQEEAARERQRQAEAEAERLRKEGDAAAAAAQTRAAQAAAAAAAAAAEKAVAVVENGNAKAAEAVMSAAAAAPVAVAQAKVSGFSMRDNYIAEFAPGHDLADAKAAIVKAIGEGRTDLLALIELDMSAANKLAKALKQAMNVPGLVAVNRPVAASRK
jgi:hypothetical protein